MSQAIGTQAAMFSETATTPMKAPKTCAWLLMIPLILNSIFLASTAHAGEVKAGNKVRIVLKDGNQISGHLLRRTEQAYFVLWEKEQIRVDKGQVRSIEALESVAGSKSEQTSKASNSSITVLPRSTKPKQAEGQLRPRKQQRARSIPGKAGISQLARIPAYPRSAGGGWMTTGFIMASLGSSGLVINGIIASSTSRPSGQGSDRTSTHILTAAVTLGGLAFATLGIVQRTGSHERQKAWRKKYPDQDPREHLSIAPYLSPKSGGLVLSGRF